MKKTFTVALLSALLSNGIVAVAAESAAATTLSSPASTAQANTVPHQAIDLTYAAEKATNSVVYIKVTGTDRGSEQVQYFDPFEDFFGDFFGRGQSPRQQQQPRQAPKRSGAGSGVILTADGYIVTNNHVVQDADEILVKLNDNREFKGRIIGLDKNTDLALIKIEADKLTPITVASSDNLKIGEWVLAIGNPLRPHFHCDSRYRQRQSALSQCGQPRGEFHPNRCCHQPRQLRRCPCQCQW